MKLELNIPKFQIPELRQINLFRNESLKALVIVIGAIIVISGAVYSAQLVRRQRSTVLPAATQVETTVVPEPTEVPTVTPEQTPEATASPTVGVTVGPAETY